MSHNGRRLDVLGRPGRKRFLVTGGAGFVGSHLCEALLAKGHHVTALDNLSTGSVDNVQQLGDEAGFDLFVGDIEDERLIESLVAESDVVIHLAAAVGVKLILADPIASFRTNVLGTEAVLEAAAKHQKKVLIASTSEVYGKVARLPQREDDDVLLGPTSYSRWSYAACKMLDEFLGLAYARKGLPVVCFRLFNTVGPRQTGVYGMVVPRFVDAALRGEPLHVYGDGSQSRCFLHVKDAVDAIMRLEQAPRAVGHIFNVGSTETVTILELANRVVASVASDPSAPPGAISFVPYEQAYPDGGFEEIPARQPDVSKIRSFTGWRPRRTLETILSDVVASQRAVRTPITIRDEVALPALA
jgi:UDP-glucose 4-epimerase